MRGRLTAIPSAKSLKATRIAWMQSFIGSSRLTSSSVMMMVKSSHSGPVKFGSSPSKNEPVLPRRPGNREGNSPYEHPRQAAAHEHAGRHREIRRQGPAAARLQPRDGLGVGREGREAEP